MSLTAALRDLNKLNTFVRVAERRSFTRAAADLRTTPSVVSKHMKELEDALGFSLLTRSTHGIALTDAGDARRLRGQDPQSADRALWHAARAGARRLCALYSRAARSGVRRPLSEPAHSAGVRARQYHSRRRGLRRHHRWCQALRARPC